MSEPSRLGDAFALLMRRLAELGPPDDNGFEVVLELGAVDFDRVAFALARELKLTAPDQVAAMMSGAAYITYSGMKIRRRSP